MEYTLEDTGVPTAPEVKPLKYELVDTDTQYSDKAVEGDKQYTKNMQYAIRRGFEESTHNTEAPIDGPRYVPDKAPKPQLLTSILANKLADHIIGRERNRQFKESIQKKRAEKRHEELKDIEVSEDFVKDLSLDPIVATREDIEKAMWEYKDQYLNDTAFGSSVTGIAIRSSVDAGFLPEMEASLDFADRTKRFVASMGWDSWLFGLGAALPKIYRGVQGLNRSAPLVATSLKLAPRVENAIQAGSMMGFHQFMREYYTQNVLWNENAVERSDYVRHLAHNMLKLTEETAKGFALGSVAGYGHVVRTDILAGIANKYLGGAAYTGMLTAESAGFAVLESQLNNPGVLPTQQEFLEAVGTNIGLDLASVGLRNSAKFVADDLKDSIVKKHVDAYKVHGTHPHTLAEDAFNDLGVMEDIVRTTHDGIRRYEEDGGLPQQKADTLIAFEKAVEESKKPTSELVKEDLLPDDFVPDESAAAQSQLSQVAAKPLIPLKLPKGVEQVDGIRLFEGEPYEIVKHPTLGIDVALPMDRKRSLALSGQGVIKSPALVRLMYAVMGKPPKLKDELAGGAHGAYHFPRGLKKKSVELLNKNADSLVRKANRMRRQKLDTTGYAERIDSLRERAKELEREDTTLNWGDIDILRGVAENDGQLLLTLTHEIGHMIDGANKGYRAGGATHLDYTEALKHYGPLYSSFKTVYDNLDSIGVDPNKVNGELEFLSRLWRPADPLTVKGRYRSDGAEMHADAFSVMMNNPAVLEKYAPNVKKAYDMYFEQRPEVAKHVKGLIKAIKDGEDMDGVNDVMMRNMEESDRVAAEKLKLDSGTLKREVDRAVSGVTAKVIDKFSAINRTVRKNRNLGNQLDRLQYHSTFKEYYAKVMNDTVLSKIDKAGVSREEFGLLMVYNRVMNDRTRQNLANTFGINPEIAEAELKKKFLELQDRIDIYEVLDGVHEARMKTVLKLVEESDVLPDDALELFKDNKAYARFQVKEYFDAMDGPGYISDKTSVGQFLTPTESSAKHEQVGSLGAVINPLAATMENDLNLIHRALKSSAVRNTVESLLEQNRTEIHAPCIEKSEAARVDKYEQHLLGSYNSTRELSTLSYPKRVFDNKTGKYKVVKKEYLVPAEIADIFNKDNTGAMSKIFSHAAQVSFKDAVTGTFRGDVSSAVVAGAKGLQYSNRFFRALVIKFSLTFQTRNALVSDAWRTYKNLPGTKHFAPYAFVTQLAPHYFKATKDSFNATFRNKWSPEQEYLHANGIVSTGLRYVEDATDTSAVDRIMYQYKVKGLENERVGSPVRYAKKQAGRVSQMFDNLFDFAEATHKQVGLTYLQEKITKGEVDFTKDQLDEYVRRNIGSPAFNRRANETTALNTIFPFFNAVKEGVMSDAKIALTKGRRLEQFSKRFINIGIPAIVGGLASAGAFDQWDDEDSLNYEDTLGAQTSYTLNNGFHIPIALGDKGTTFKIPLSQDPDSRFMYGAIRSLVHDAYKAKIGGDEEASDFIDGLMEVASGALLTPKEEIPGFAPGISFGARALGIATEGNFFDPFLGRMKYTPSEQDIMNMDVMEKMKAIAEEGVRTMGVPGYAVDWLNENPKYLDDEYVTAINKAFAPTGDDSLDDVSRSFNKVLDHPFTKYAFGAFISHSDKGIREKVMLEKKRQRELSAVKRGEADELATMTLNGHVPEVVLDKDMYKRVQRAMKSKRVQSINDPWIREIMSTSGKGRESVIKVMQQSNRGRKTLKKIIEMGN